jgi:hypothetical protein
MVERILSPRLADIVEAIERVRLILTGVSLEAFELDWEKRWWSNAELRFFPRRAVIFRPT